MVRYVGAAVATAPAATIYGKPSPAGPPRASRASTPCPSVLAAASWAIGVFSLAGVGLAVVMGRHRVAHGILADSGAAAAAHSHSLPTSATSTVDRSVGGHGPDSGMKRRSLEAGRLVGTCSGQAPVAEWLQAVVSS